MSNASSFVTVFDKVKFSGGVKDIFSNANVKNISISRKTRAMTVNLALGHIINERCIFDLERELLNLFPDLTDVDVNLEYSLNQSANKEIVDMYWGNVVSAVMFRSPLYGTILSEAAVKVSYNNLIVFLKNNSSFFLYKSGIDKKIQTLFMERFGLSLNVSFEDSNVVYKNDDYLKEHESFVKQALNCAPVKKQSLKSSSIKNGAVFGKAILGHSVKIINTKTEGELVIIYGEVFKRDFREIKGDKVIVIFDITDFSDSTTVKFFLKKEKFNDDIKSAISVGQWLKVRGTVQFDKYSNELNIIASDVELSDKPSERIDCSKEKRVELHLHTQMSSMDGVTSVKKYIQRAASWGHSAIAITDHGVVQAFPDACAAAKSSGIKVIYGVECYLIDDLGAVVQCPNGQSLDDTFVVFDIETTGLSKEKNSIIEIGAIKIQKGKIIDRFSSFVNPHVNLPAEIIKLTNISDEMLMGAPSLSDVLPAFLCFIEGSVVVAHNAGFDMGFIRFAATKKNIEVNNTVLDTLELSRTLFPSLSKHKLDVVCGHLGIKLTNHHRAVDDAFATAQILIKCFDILKEQGITNVNEINMLASKQMDFKKLKTYHAIILVQNKTGLRNLYELISKSHLYYFYRKPRVPKSEFLKLRDGLIIGSACEAGELYKAIMDKRPAEYIQELVEFYDYLEIQPTGNNMFLVNSGKVSSVEELQDINRSIVELGKRYSKPVVATCDVHFIDPKDEVYRRILMFGEGFKDADNQAPLYFRTTKEMLDEFAYLGDEIAKEVVITNTNKISDMIEKIKPIPDETFPPKIPGAEEELTKITMDKAKSIYGETLPPIVEARLEKELNSIIKNGFAVLYIIAQKLVWKSLEDGYLVGSRGSVGSSFVATMATITEVNPLPPHYICPNCKYSDFDSSIVKEFAGGSGCDMPDKKCPVCDTLLKKDGHDIPFETFLGFDGDKEPDIDLNFSGDYQQNAHAYTEQLFGTGFVFKAGTIGTLAEKTAFGFIKKYLDEKNIVAHNAEINRLVCGCTGVKRTTGQHPGGLMVVPNDHSIYEFCPIQRPANDINSTITTTHFDYHSISGRLLKLDLLGHDDPTVIRMLQDLTEVNPQTVPLDDKKTMSLFLSPQALEVTAEEISCETGTLGIPEFGTKFVRQMLVDTRPTTFAELIRIAGLSHGTDVWLNNAQELVRSNTAELKDVISTRDDIMVYLIIKGVENKRAFKIMEKVRKGRGLDESDVAVMKDANVPQWYINSCNKIKYMFPKAHAAAYVMMAFRIAYFKVHHKEAFYASYFTVRADDFDYETMCKGINICQNAIKDIEQKGNTATTKEKNKLTILEVVNEMYMRNIKFIPLDLYKSDAVKFIITKDGILPPLNSVQGLGINAALGLAKARLNGKFYSLEDLRMRTGISKTVVKLLQDNNILKGLTETNQLTLF